MSTERPAPKKFFVVPGPGCWYVVYQLAGVHALQVVEDCRTEKGALDEAWRLNGHVTPEGTTVGRLPLKRDFSEARQASLL